MEELKDLWGHQICIVWVPSRNINLSVLLSTLDNKIPRSYFSKERVKYIAVAGKVTNAIAEDVLLSPLQGGLIPLPHQLKILERVFAGDHIRYLLADEVGLGKTIEAGLIMRELKLRGLIKRILIILPSGLMFQWSQEMRNHFNEKFHIIKAQELSIFSNFFEDENLWSHFDQIICPMDSVKPLEQRKGWTAEDIAEYNLRRFEALIAAGWDLIIIDEAHRVAGSTPYVARHILGKSLADAAPYILLLSGTPHQGKSDAFQRLLSIIDKQEFPPNTTITKEMIEPYVLRTEKRKAVDVKGNPLFKPRETKLITVKWDLNKHQLQQELYEKVTEYVRTGYNQAIEEERNYIGFLLVLMQRLVTSSTKAINDALTKRLQVLDNQMQLESSKPDLTSEFWDELNGQEQLNQLIGLKNEKLKYEKDTVEKLQVFAIKCENEGPDVKTEKLLEIIIEQQQEESDIDLKFLIFTEFVATQEMLKDYLENHGFPCATLNGSMTLEDRQTAQEKFAREAKILISTDAGGEGLNLQFCHIIINYDLPWNPMKVEQRIGRVDRIGQESVVKAFNFILEDTVEYRIFDVLQEKLEIILREFGVDKSSDVLDSLDWGKSFEKVYINSILTPEETEKNVGELAGSIRNAMERLESGKSLLPDVGPINLDLSEKVANHPLPLWLEIMTLNFIKMMGGQVYQTFHGYDLNLPSEFDYRGVTFNKNDADKYGLTHLTIENESVKMILNHLNPVSLELPVPTIRITTLPESISGLFSLWKLSIINAPIQSSRIFPLFILYDGKILRPSSYHIWNAILEQHSEIDIQADQVDSLEISEEILLSEKAREVGQDYFLELEQKYQATLERERQKIKYNFEIRQDSIHKLGLPNVRKKRLKDLQKERQKWEKNLNLRQTIIPNLEPLLILKISGENNA